MRNITVLRFALWGLAALSILACANPVGSSSSAAASSTSSSSAAYAKLDVSNSTAWAAAVAAGDVRQGHVLVKTGSNFSSSSLTALGATQTGSISILGGTWWHLTVPTGSEPSTILALRKIKGVMAAEPELRLKLPTNETRTRPTGLPSSLLSSLSMSKTKSLVSGSAVSTYYSEVFGTDPDPFLASMEYSLEITNAYEAYNTYNPSKLSSSNYAYAAQLDTGLNFPHEDFSGLTIKHPMSAFTRNSATSYTYVGDGGSFVSMDTTENWDDDGHGTHTAGIIGAVGDNGTGGAGVMWSHLKLIPYKVLTDYETDSEDGSGSDWAVYGALLDVAAWWATSGNHSDSSQVTLPVNMSLGGYYASEFEIEAIDYALEKNVVVVAAMGNDGRITAEYPAAYSGVIAVGATDGTDTVASFSTRGSWMAVSAPGVDIISTYNGSDSDYEYDSGTSMATPFVTGLSAYTLAFAPSLYPDQLKTVLMEEADSIDNSSYTSVSSSYGAGRVDVYNTVTTAVSSPPSSGSVYCTEPVTITVTVSGTATEGIPVYLYNSSGNFIQVGYTGDGSGYTTTSGTVTPGTAGQVSFYLLAPGTYTATAVNGSSSKSRTVTASSSATTATIAL